MYIAGSWQYIPKDHEYRFVQPATDGTVKVLVTITKTALWAPNRVVPLLKAAFKEDLQQWHVESLLKLIAQVAARKERVIQRQKEEAIKGHPVRRLSVALGIPEEEARDILHDLSDTDMDHLVLSVEQFGTPVL